MHSKKVGFNQIKKKLCNKKINKTLKQNLKNI